MTSDDAKVAVIKFYEQIEKDEILSFEESVMRRKVEIASFLDQLKTDQINRVRKVFDELIADSNRDVTDESKITELQTKQQKSIDMISLRVAVAVAMVNNGFGKCQEVSLQLIENSNASSQVSNDSGLSEVDFNSIRDMLIVTTALSKGNYFLLAYINTNS